MKVLYDATPLLMRSAGVKNYHHALLSRLLPLMAPDSLDLFPYLRGLTPNHNERSNYTSPGTALRLGAVLASNYAGMPLGRWASRDANLFHMTHHLWNPPGDRPLSSMIHDTTPILLPECHTESNIRYFEKFVENTLPQLKGVITPSAAVKREVVDHLGYPEDRVMTIYHGVDADFFEATHASRRKAREEYGLPSNYVLFVGSIEPRKNLLRLLQAYGKLPGSLRKDFPLVITGASGWKNAEIQQAMAAIPTVIPTGYIRRVLLPPIYHMATCFVFPSLYEGFGMPLLEAMAAGLPIITSNTSALPEVAGETALLVDPTDVDQMSEALEALLSMPQSFGDLGLAAQTRAREFTWERAAAATKKFFELCLRN